jgi:hypothetical protein
MSAIAQNIAARFNASLPTPYEENWREAYRADSGDSPRTASYQAPGGEAIPFIQKSFRFSGGQSQDTAEYPFGGLWSNEYLNEKPQSLTVEGYLRGPAYIAQRNKLIGRPGPYPGACSGKFTTTEKVYSNFRIGVWTRPV